MPVLDTKGLERLWSHIVLKLQNKVDVESGKGLSTNDYTTTEKNKLFGIAANAEVNQNAFSNVSVGSTTIAANSKTDTLTLVAGNNITLTPDSANDKITIAAESATYGNATQSAAGLMSADDKKKLDGVAANANAYSHPTYTSKSSGLYKVTVDSTGHVSAATAVAKADITGLGIPAQDTVYTHPSHTAKPSGLYKVTVDALGHVTAATAVAKSDITDLGIPAQDTVYTHPNSGVTAGTYKSVTVNAQGHVTAGSNPTTLSGYGITDAIPTSAKGAASGVASLGTDGKVPTSQLPALGETNQNAFTNVAVGSTTIAADSKTDTLTIEAGSNITITPDATNDKITIAATDTTYSAATTSANGLMTSAMVTKLDGIAENANNYSHPTSAGNKHIPSGGSSGQILRWSASGTAVWGADNNTTYEAATQSAAGLMSADDKKKLDGIAAGATANTGDITGVTAGNGLTDGGTSGSVTLNVGAGVGIAVAADAVKAKLRSETALTVDSAAATTTSGRVYPVAVDKTGYLAVNVPWTDTDTDTHHTANLITGASSSAKANAAASDGSVYLNLVENNTVRNSHLIDGTGTVTVTSDANGKITINGSAHPTVNNATISITAGAGLTGSGDFTTNQSSAETITLGHSNSVTAATASEGGSSRTLAFGGAFNIPSVTYDAQGHITGKGSIELKLPANPNTDTGATSVEVTGSGNAITTASYDESSRKLTLTKGATYNNYTLPVAKYNTLGGIKPAYTSTNAATLTTAAATNTTTPTIAAKSTTSDRYYAVEGDKNGVLFVNVPWTDTNTQAVSSVNGKTGAVSLTYSDVGAAAATHNHAASEITSGTLASARLPAATSSALGAVKIASNGNITNNSGTISVPDADGSTKGVTIVYPAASCTTFSSDSGTVTPLAVQKGAKMFAITRPPKDSPSRTVTPKAIARWLDTDGGLDNSIIAIEDVTNSRDSSKKAQVIAIPAEGGKKMVYGYCTDQVDGTSFIGGVFDQSATSYPYNEGLAIGGTSGNLLWKGAKVATVNDIVTYSAITNAQIDAICGQ